MSTKLIATFIPQIQSAQEDGYVCRKCWLKVSIFHEFYTYIESMHDTGQERMMECGSDAMKIERESADESELGAENMKSEMDSKDFDDCGLNGHVSDVKCDSIEKVVVKMPERKEKLKKVPESNVKKKSFKTRNDVNETFQ